jgi:hypothetical protein
VKSQFIEGFIETTTDALKERNSGRSKARSQYTRHRHSITISTLVCPQVFLEKSVSGKISNTRVGYFIGVYTSRHKWQSASCKRRFWYYVTVKRKSAALFLQGAISGCILPSDKEYKNSVNNNLEKGEEFLTKNVFFGRADCQVSRKIKKYNANIWESEIPHDRLEHFKRYSQGLHVVCSDPRLFKRNHFPAEASAATNSYGNTLDMRG